MNAEDIRSKMPKELEITIEPVDVEGAIRGESDACVISNAFARTLNLDPSVDAWVDPNDVEVQWHEDGFTPVTICTYHMSGNSTYVVEHFDGTGEAAVGTKIKASLGDVK